MNQHRLNRLAAALSLATLLVACGGADGPAPTVHPMANAAAVAQPGGTLPGTDERRRALGTDDRQRALGTDDRQRALSTDYRQRALAVQGSIDATMLFNWIETVFPALFPKGPQNQPLTAGGVTYTLRYYPPPANNYAGVGSDGNVYGLGAFTNNQIKNFGPLQGFACDVAPNLCVDPPPQGALNECADPAASTLATGFNVKLVYVESGVNSGEWSIDSTVIGPATFEGLSAIQVNSVFLSSNTVDGFAVTTTITNRAFHQPGSGGLVKTFGNLTDSDTSGIVVGGTPFPGTVSKTKSVYNPPIENIEFTLQPGQSLTKTITSTTTTLVPVGTPAENTTSSVVHAFEAKEMITVLGKSYNTCRYRVTSSPSDSVGFFSWLIVGKGIAAKTQVTIYGQTHITELKSGSYNGQPL